MKIFKRIFAFILLLLTIFTTSSCGTVKRDPSEFDDFSRQVLELVVGDSEMAINFLFKNPEAYGIPRGNAYLYQPSESNSAVGMFLINFILGQIDGFDYNELSFDQQMTYHVIKDLTADINNIIQDESYMGRSYLGSYLGYQAQLPIQLLNYNLRDKQDLDNYFIYIDEVDNTFQAYYNFEVRSADKGYGMPDFVIDKVVGQCQGFLTNIESESHFMIKTMNDRIDKLTFLTDAEKEYYKQLNRDKVRGPMADGYRYVMENLPSLKGRATNNMGLAHYKDAKGNEIGKQYYEKVFQEAVGYNVSVNDALVYIEEKLIQSNERIDAVRIYYQEHPEELEKIKNIEFMEGGIEEQLEYYQEIIKGYYPEVNTNFNLEILYVDEALQEYYSPAAYFLSAIDDRKSEKIVLNPGEIYIYGTNELDKEYLSTALAHEGFPGHMYQHIYFKTSEANLLRKVLRDSGYQEGWANYSETFTYEYYFDKHPEFSEYALEYYLAQVDFQAAFYTKLDIGIHYLGWTLEETGAYIKEYLDVDDDAIKRVYEQLIEVPGNYPTYFYTYLKIIDLRNYAISKGGSVLEFNTLMLDCGPIGLEHVEEYIRSYYEK